MTSRRGRTTAPDYRPPHMRPVVPTHSYAGSNSDRQCVGLPGHCERCAEVGHVLAHPDLGCGDVGCTRDHPPGLACDEPAVNLDSATLDLLAWDVSDAFAKDVDRHGLDFGLNEIRAALPAFIAAIRMHATNATGSEGKS